MGTSSESEEPLEIYAPLEGDHIQIKWRDGLISSLPLRLLRGFCPCAYCQGHGGPIRWVEEALSSDLRIREIGEVGNYAIRILWSDGHGSGIYSFRFLRKLHELGSKKEQEWRQTELGRL
ncbi:MAG: DUF971 domain-containing protein [Deltaproteobacteria bacterium]|nr:DUF971 domain-containing protein [Deltaproteobacteria bacterium]